MAKKSKTEKKNKGPKGKKARAAAKLERQWGEEAPDKTKNDGKRIGRSRILSNGQRPARSTTTHPTSDTLDHTLGQDLEQQQDDHNPSNENDIDEESHSSMSDDENLDLTAGGAYFSKLIKNIKASNNHRRDSGSDSESDDSEDDDAAENHGRGMEIEESSSEESEDDADDDGVGGKNTDPGLDFFEKRFSSTSPLPEDTGKRDELIRQLHQTDKILVPHVDPTLELQVSKSLVAEMGIGPGNAVPKQEWKRLSKESYAGVNDFLKQGWEKVKNDQMRQKSTLSSLQSTLHPFLTRYTDCLITPKSSANRGQISNLALLHIVNHVLSSRDRIQRNNQRLKSLPDDSAMNDESSENDQFKDQGYTRPTVLVMLPTRGTCHRFIHLLTKLTGDSVPEEYLDRFNTEFGPPPPEEELKEMRDEALKRHRRKVLEEKGGAWQELFGDNVNDDDDFKLGIALYAKKSDGAKTEKRSGSKKKDRFASAHAINVKLYTDFYSSDIIVASPLGLKMAISSDSNDGEADFLSSVEICLIDRTDVLMMQNWDHVNDVLENINQLPKSNNETDFARVRNYFLVDQAANWRQLIILSDILDPLMLSTFKRYAKSHSGILKSRRRIPEDDGSISKVIVPTRQIFQRIPTQTFTTMSDVRLKYFTQNILPQIRHSGQKHTMIFIPSYFDFVLVRNHLIRTEADFVSITEYSRVSETSRGRARFLQGRKPLMLYTGRAHFFLRHKIKGIRNLIFFGLPEHPDFYADLVNVINEGLEDSYADSNTEASSTSSIALFTKYEVHALERIVGSQQSTRMVKGEKSTFIFVS